MLCMEQGCGKEFTEQDIRILAGDILYKKYHRFKENIRVELDPNLKWCSKIGCEFYVERKVDLISNIINTRKVTCQCGQEVCFECGGHYHEQMPCPVQTNEEL